MRRLALITLLGCAACASAEDARFLRPEHATWDDPAESEWQSEQQSERQSGESDIVRRTTFQGPDGAYEVMYDEAGRAVVPQEPLPPVEPPSRPPRVGPRTVTLRQAPLDSALRMLAEAGNFNLLLEGELSEPVSGELRDVEPYEAVVALAGTHGAFVRFEGNIVIVTAH